MAEKPHHGFINRSVGNHHHPFVIFMFFKNIPEKIRRSFGNPFKGFAVLRRHIFFRCIEKRCEFACLIAADFCKVRPFQFAEADLFNPLIYDHRKISVPSQNVRRITGTF